APGAAGGAPKSDPSAGWPGTVLWRAPRRGAAVGALVGWTGAAGGGCPAARLPAARGGAAGGAPGRGGGGGPPRGGGGGAPRGGVVRPWAVGAVPPSAVGAARWAPRSGRPSGRAPSSEPARGLPTPCCADQPG